METMTAVLDMTVYGNSVLRWGISAGLFVVAVAALLALKGFVVGQTRRLAQAKHNLWVTSLISAAQNTKGFVVVVLAAWIASLQLSLPERLVDGLWMVAVATLFIQIGLWGTRATSEGLSTYRQLQISSDPALATSLNAVSFVARLLIWASVFLLVLDNFGVNITALVAGLGIGGIAVALAAQNVLGDLFASLSIVLDKPFVVGDFLILNDYMGTVEYVGLKNTRLRSLSGEQIILANSDILSSRVRNYGRMSERRVPVTIGVTYQTPRAKLERIPHFIQTAVESQEHTRFDRAHFVAFGASSLDFEYVYYIASADYNQYMDINQAINLAIHKRFEEEGIDFAYPTQTLYLHPVEAPKPA